MIDNLAEFFDPVQKIFLETISYKRLDALDENVNKNYSLTCQDNIKADYNNESVRIILTRTLKFDPEEIFFLSVSFGAILKFTDKKDEYDWSSINLAEEFKDNGNFIIPQLMSRISLLIGQITSSYGQQPIILPPNIGNKF